MNRSTREGHLVILMKMKYGGQQNTTLGDSISPFTGLLLAFLEIFLRSALSLENFLFLYFITNGVCVISREENMEAILIYREAECYFREDEKCADNPICSICSRKFS